MRLIIKVTGKGSGDKLAYMMDLMQPLPFGRDNPLSIMFMNSLSDSIKRWMFRTNDESVKEGKLTDKDVAYCQTHQENGDYATIYVDCWMESKKGRSMYFCKIANDECNSSVRTRNALPIVTRCIWGLAKCLKKTKTPIGCECLNSINILKNYMESDQSIRMVSVDDDKIVINPISAQ